MNTQLTNTNGAVQAPTGELFQLIVSLDEVLSYNPCRGGRAAAEWLANDTGVTALPLTAVVHLLPADQLSFICWLLGKRKTEISIAVSFANKCVESAAHLRQVYSADAEYAAEYANAYATAANAAYATAEYAAEYAAADANAAEYAAADAAEYAADAAAYANAAAAADAANATATAYAAYAANATAYANARKQQYKKNKQFMLEAIQEYEAAQQAILDQQQQAQQ